MRHYSRVSIDGQTQLNEPANERWKNKTKKKKSSLFVALFSLFYRTNNRIDGEQFFSSSSRCDCVLVSFFAFDITVVAQQKFGAKNVDENLEKK